MINKIILSAGPLNAAMSYEYHNFLKPLEKMGITVVPFDFPLFLKQMGKEAMNRLLVDTVKKEKPDLVFVPHTDQFIPETIDEINHHTITMGYFFDDMWRIEYSRFWAKHFRFVTTSDVNGLDKFKAAGFDNVIYSPFACNPDVFCKKEQPKKYDVSFVGQYQTTREWYLSYLKKMGVNVHIWGLGWPSGMLKHEEMVNVFNQSRINLNLSNCISWDIRTLFPSKSLKKTYRAWKQVLKAATQKDMKTVEQIKGRHFEINACGGFQLTYYVEGLERMFAIGDEIAIFMSANDMVEKIRFFLKNEKRREEIARNGQLRAVRDHSMEKRFIDMFSTIGLA